MKLRTNNITHIILVGLVSIVLQSCQDDPIELDSFGTLTGTVIDSFNEEPLANVEINTNPSSSVVFSDSLGRFIMEEIAVGDYSFTARLAGYEKTFVNVGISLNTTTEVTIKMERLSSSPDAATNPVPASGASDQSRDITLAWESTPATNDSLIYDVVVYESGIDSAMFSSFDLPDTFLILNNLRYETTYFWQVTAKSVIGGSAESTIWNFTTLDYPDNRYIYAAKVNGRHQLFSSDESQDQKIQLTRNTYNNLNPLFSNNRSEIAFSANQSLDYQIFISDFKGKNSRQITSLPLNSYHSNKAEFCWWPDNGGFIYSHYDKLYSIDRNGANLQLVSTALPGRNFRSCDYSGVIGKIVVETVGVLPYKGEIYLMNPDGTDTVRIVDDLPGVVRNPSFSIDGTQVLYTQDISGFESADGRQLDSRIFLLDLATMVSTNISTNKPDGTNDSQPRFSPFGSDIIFTNQLNDGSGEASIYVMEVDGSARTILFENGEMPHWK